MCLAETWMWVDLIGRLNRPQKLSMFATWCLIPGLGIDAHPFLGVVIDAAMGVVGAAQ